ncbi:MAG: outer membrane protein assembly factor BamD [Gammaproteobacteria bacterium]|jgi:outer membrane protein assembly factor BamD
MPTRLILFTICTLLLTACGPVKEVDVTEGWNVEKLFRNARSEMNKGNYQTAIDRYEILESRFPFGYYATQAQLDIAYTYFKYGQADSAVAAIERFIKLNPRHETTDYAYYLKGVINFNRGGSVLDKIVDRDLSDFDRNILLTAYDDFQYVIRQYPESSYADDSKQRIIYLRNQLAVSDLKIAQYYASRSAWVAAASRTQSIIRDFQGTTAIKQTLELQLQAYQALGLDELVKDTQRIIDLNYGVDS